MESAVELHNRRLFRSEEFADVKLTAFGKTYRLHRFCLVRSPFFERMFKGEWAESDTREVNLDSCNPMQGLTREGLEHALEYLYCAKLSTPKSLDDFGEALLVLKFLLMDESVEDLLRNLDRSLECKDLKRVTDTAVLCRDSIKGLWDLTLAVLAYDPCRVMNYAKEIHKDVLVGLISHPGLRIRKDITRYALAEHVLKECVSEDPNSASRSNKRARTLPEFNDFAQKLFATLPEWKITHDDIRTIRERGLVPDTLMLDWFLHPLRKYPIDDAVGFDVTISDGEVVAAVPESWRQLKVGNERLDKRQPLVANCHRCTGLFDNNEPPVCFVATDYGLPDLPLSLACHLKLEAVGRPAAELLEGCSLRLHSSKGTVSDGTIFSHPVHSGKDLVLGHVDAPRNGHVFVVLCIPQRWGIGSYTRTTITSIMEEYHGY